MKCPIEGLIHVTGCHDTGKTTFAYTAGPAPDKIAFFDNDIKGKSVHEQLGFGAYYNLVRMFTEGKNYKPLAFFEMVMRLLDDLGEFELIVFDNWTQMEAGIAAYTDNHITEMSDLTPGQAKNMSQLTWPAKRIMYGRVLDTFLEKAPTMVVTTHLKDKWVGNIRTDAQIPQCQKPLTEKCSLRLWLRHNPDGPEPIGLVLKRISQSVYSKKLDRIVPVSVLPRKVKPCTWEVIGEYIKEPLGDRVGEVPDEFELGILDGVLTADQKMMLEAALVANRGEEKAKELGVKEDVKRLIEEGMKAKDVAEKLGLSVVEVRGVM